MVKSCVFCAAIVLCCVVTALSKGEGQLPNIKAKTELVQLPVVAHRDGKHVGGLKVDAFAVLMDGKPQALAVFEEVHPSLPVKPTQTEEFSNVAEGRRDMAEQLTIIAIDLNNTQPLDQAYLKEEVIKFLDSAAKTGEPFALIAVTRSGIRVLHDFTTDPKLLAASVKGQPLQIAAKEAAGGTVMDFTPCARSAAGCGGGANADIGMQQLQAWTQLMTNQEVFEIYRDRATGISTLVALQQLAQALRGLPGRKTLVWASSGTQIFGGMSRMFAGSKDPRGGASTDMTRVGETLDQYAHTFNLLNLANVAVYPLDARHGSNISFANYDVVYSDAPLSEAVDAVRGSNSEIIDSFKAMAAATGGKPCFNRTDLAGCLQEAADDSHHYYLLGFYLDDKTKPGWHPISVRLDGPRTELTYRGGFFLETSSPEKSKLTDMQLALISPLNYTALPIRGKFESPVDKGDKKLIGFALDVPAGAIILNEGDSRLLLDIAVIVRGKGGKEIAKLAQRIDRVLTAEQMAVIRAQGIHYTNKLELPPGDYGVWFAVRESTTGRTGSVVASVNAK
jgi:VWFA-related protein